MYRLTIITALLLASCAAAAQAPVPGGEPQRVVRRMAPPPPARSGDTADVAMSFFEGLPTIMATVNGKGPYRFGVDTGAMGYLRLRPDLAATLGLAPIGEARASDPSGRSSVAVSLYRVDTLQFGGLTYRGIMTSGLTIPGKLGELDGIIGIGFFRDLLLTLDYGRGRLQARLGALPAANGRDVVQASVAATGLFSIPVTIGGKILNVHLDTGNTRQPLFLSEAEARALPAAGAPRAAGTARTVSQEIEIFALALAAPVKVGATLLPVKEVAWPALREGNIGSKALAGMAVTLDAANQRVRIVPSPR